MNIWQVYNRWFLSVEKIVVTLVIVSFFFTPLSQFFSFYKLPVQVAEAAQVTVDATAEPTGASHLQAGPQTVFISDQVGYKFFRGYNTGEK